MRIDHLDAYNSYAATLPRVTPPLAGGPETLGDSDDNYDTVIDQKASESRDLVTIRLPERIKKLVVPPAGTSETDQGEFYNVRKISPRETSELSMDLYLEGVLNWEEYSMLAFQPELHPDYNATIGALTNTEAEPDKPRDIVKEWEEKLSFELRHADQSGKRVAQAQRINAVLKLIDQPVEDEPINMVA